METSNIEEEGLGMQIRFVDQESNKQSIESILEERGGNYGSFKSQSILSQNLKRTIQEHPKYEALPLYVKEAFEMVLHKMSRVVNGDHEYIDSYTDIIGYTQLIIDEKKQQLDE